jgi:nucleoside-diphosphate-sugar epimerase
VLAISRRAPPLPPGARHVRIDLLDLADCMRLKAYPHVTHVVFAALYEKPALVAGWRDPEQMQTNLAMLRNLLDAIDAFPELRHITLLQGTKAYGSHVEPIRNPAKERWPRHPHENFYWLQEDLLRERQPAHRWSFSILRPQVVLGYAHGSPMNVVAALGAYAAVMRELGEPLAFPGGGPFMNGATDARLLARAMAFVGTQSVAANETYNVVNGDVLVWQDVWPSIAGLFQMNAAGPRPMNLARTMPEHEDVWARVVGKHGLRRITLAELVGSSWEFTDRVFGFGVAHPAHSVLSPIKLRQAGFHDCEDTEDALLYWLRRMQDARLLPR